MNQIFQFWRKYFESVSDLVVFNSANVRSNVKKVSEIFSYQLKKAFPVANDPYVFEYFLKFLDFLPFLTIL